MVVVAGVVAVVVVVVVVVVLVVVVLVVVVVVAGVVAAVVVVVVIVVVVVVVRAGSSVSCLPNCTLLAGFRVLLVSAFASYPPTRRDSCRSLKALAPSPDPRDLDLTP